MKCQYCHQEFQTDNPKAKFCSDKCRIYLRRQQNRGTIGDEPDTDDVDSVAMEESYSVPGVDPFWTKPHKLVFHSNSEWRGCCIAPETWRAHCPRTGDEVIGKTYPEMMNLAREKAKQHISEEVAHPMWTARMPQSVKPPKELDRSKSMIPQSK